MLSLNFSGPGAPYLAPKTSMQRSRRLALRRRLRHFRRNSVGYALIAGALFATMIVRQPEPDIFGPAVVQHPQYGELYRRARIDPHEDCLEVWWETRYGEIKFRNLHCPSPLKTP